MKVSRVVCGEVAAAGHLELAEAVLAVRLFSPQIHQGSFASVFSRSETILATGPFQNAGAGSWFQCACGG